MAGGGVSVLTTPSTNFDYANKTIKLEDNLGKYFMVQGTAGIEYKFSKSIVLYSEVTFNKIPTTTFFTNNKINTLNFQVIGFKTTF